MRLFTRFYRDAESYNMTRMHKIMTLEFISTKSAPVFTKKQQNLQLAKKCFLHVAIRSKEHAQEILSFTLVECQDKLFTARAKGLAIRTILQSALIRYHRKALLSRFHLNVENFIVHLQLKFKDNGKQL